MEVSLSWAEWMAASDGGPLVEWILFLLSAPPLLSPFYNKPNVRVSFPQTRLSWGFVFFREKNRWFIHKCYVITILMLRYMKPTRTCSAHRHLHQLSKQYLHIQKLKTHRGRFGLTNASSFSDKELRPAEFFPVTYSMFSDFSSCSTRTSSSIIHAWCPRFHLVNNRFILKSEIILDVNSCWIIAPLWNQPAQTPWIKTAFTWIFF